MDTHSAAPPQDAGREFVVRIEQVRDYEFRILFDNPRIPALISDEPAPLGRDAGPNAAHLLAAAIGNCLSASLLFCATRARLTCGQIRTQVRMELKRNEQGRLRIGRVQVVLDPGIAAQDRERSQRCLRVFRDYCTVTESVRRGVPVDVTVAGMEEPLPSAL